MIGKDRITPFSKGTHFMWDDPHISKQLLKFHLDPNFDAASRRPEIIDRTLEWIEHLLEENSRILDLGCGPGLYCQRLASAGHRVTGLDISKNSIEYARTYAEKNGLDIRYINGDYTAGDIPQENDLVMIIFCDIGVFDDETRDLLLKKIHESLKTGGRITFDVAGPGFLDDFEEGTKTERHDGGFWSPEPYTHIEEVMKFPELKAMLHEHTISLDNGETRTYRFWDRSYSKEEIGSFLKEAGFSNIEFKDDIVEDSNFRMNKVIFTSAMKE
jgi:SAM-dependent methyltransferase